MKLSRFQFKHPSIILPVSPSHTLSHLVSTNKNQSSKHQQAGGDEKAFLYLYFAFLLTQDKKGDLIEPEVDESKVNSPLMFEARHHNKL